MQIRFLTLLSSAFLCFSLSLTKTPSEAPDEFDQILFDWTGTWAHVAQLAKEKHYHIDSIQKAMVAGIDAFISTLDPHSKFLDNQEYNSILESTIGEFYGIGVVINNTRSSKEKFLTLIEIIPDGPASKSGLLQYDKIVEIDGKALEGMSTQEATKLLKGKKGTTVTVKVLREGSFDLLTFTITRDVVKEQQSLCFYLKEKNIYYLSLSMFAENSVQQLEKLLKKAQKQEPRGLILDLRNNSGGLLNAAIEIAGLFLDKESVVVTTKNNKGEETERYTTKRNPIARPGMLLCILINNYTASAAEILAGCLKVHAEKLDQQHPLMVFIVGTPSFGKGSVQEVIPVGSNCALKLTTSLYFLPYDTNVQGVGILPDIHIERCLPPSEQIKWLTESYGRENTLENYICIDKEGKAQEKENKNKKIEESNNNKKNNEKDSWNKRVQTMLQQDNQLKEAINLISLIYNGQRNLRRVITDRKSALLYIQSNYVCNDKIEVQEVVL
jgi:carboxyl-terminal processing protease